MLNILVNAYAVSPCWGSEPGVGWNWIVNLAKDCNVFVITESEWENEIKEAVKKLPQCDNLHFYFNSVTPKVRDICWHQGDWRFYYYYRQWQKKSLKIAKDITAQNKIDIIHQLNMIGFREPGYLWKIKNIPFIWGPIGNMSPMDMSFANNLPFLQRQKLRLKNWITCFQARNGRVKKAILHADTVYTALEDTAEIVRKVYRKGRVYTLPETGLKITADYTHPIKSSGPLNLLWVGRFISTKKLDLALEVMAQLPKEQFILHIVGWGTDSEEERYKKFAEELHISNQCIWHGKLPNEDVQQLMRDSDVFLFTSVVEGTPHVILESISNNLPIVCFNLCGQGVIVDEKVGIRIPAKNIENMKAGMKASLEKLYKERLLLHNLSKGCEIRKPELSWDSKIKEVIRTYVNAVQRIRNHDM